MLQNVATLDKMMLIHEIYEFERGNETNFKVFDLCSFWELIK